jgi:phytoene synthase
LFVSIFDAMVAPKSLHFIQGCHLARRSKQYSKRYGYAVVNYENSHKLVRNIVMNAEFLQLSPPKRLALTHANAVLRDYLGLLLLLDERLASMVLHNREVIIGQMRIAWWNDVIAKPTSGRPKGEPLLTLLGEVEAGGLGDAARSSCTQLLEAWERLLVDDERSEASMATHARLRGDAIFGGYARIAGVNESAVQAATALGTHWAGQTLSPVQKLPRKLRSLSILAKAAVLEQSGNRRAGLALTWHALTGR